MPSIRKRKGKYQVQVRIQGQQISKTFTQLKDAKKWGMFYENKINHIISMEKINKIVGSVPNYVDTLSFGSL